MAVEFLATEPEKIRQFVLLPYKTKYENHETESIYVAFLEKTLADAENGLTVPYLVLNTEEKIIGVFALSASSIRFEEMEESDIGDWKLYEDLTEYPAIRLDLFLILPPYRKKGFGSQTLDDIVAYLDSKRTSFIGYRYLITLSTSEAFDRLLLAKSFKPFPVEEVEEFRQNGFYRNTPEDTVEILRKELKKQGIWFYLNFGGL